MPEKITQKYPSGVGVEGFGKLTICFQCKRRESVMYAEWKNGHWLTAVWDKKDEPPRTQRALRIDSNRMDRIILVNN